MRVGLHTERRRHPTVRWRWACASCVCRRCMNLARRWAGVSSCADAARTEHGGSAPYRVYGAHGSEQGLQDWIRLAPPRTHKVCSIANIVSEELIDACIDAGITKTVNRHLDDADQHRLMTALQVLQGSPQADRIKQEKDEKSNAPTLGLMIALAGGVSNTSDDQGCTSCACLVFISSE